MRNKIIISILSMILLVVLAFSLAACDKSITCDCPEPTPPCECPTTPTDRPEPTPTPPCDCPEPTPVPPCDCPEPTPVPPCDCPEPTPPCECPPPVVAPPLPSNFTIDFTLTDISTESYVSSATSHLSVGTWFVTTFNIINNNDDVLKLDFSLSFGENYQSKSITQIPTSIGARMILFGNYYSNLSSSINYAKNYLTDHFYLSPGVQRKVIVAFYIPPKDSATNTQYTMDDGNFNLMIKEHNATTNTYTLLKTVPVTGALHQKP